MSLLFAGVQIRSGFPCWVVPEGRVMVMFFILGSSGGNTEALAAAKKKK